MAGSQDDSELFSFCLAPLRSSTGAGWAALRVVWLEGPYPPPSLVVGIVQPVTARATATTLETVRSRRRRGIAVLPWSENFPGHLGTLGCVIGFPKSLKNYGRMRARECGNGRTPTAAAGAAAPGHETAAKALSPLACPSPRPPPRRRGPAARPG